MRRVVVTGLGTVNPLGLGVDDTWKQARSGVSGIGPITLFDASEFATSIAGEVRGLELDAYLARKEYRRMDRSAQFFWVATAQAMADAGLSYEEDDPAADRAGVVIGSGIGGISTTQDEMDVLRDRGPGRVSPLAITKVISNMGAGLVSIDFHLYGPNNCTVTACAASANAIGDAYEHHPPRRRRRHGGGRHRGRDLRVRRCRFRLGQGGEHPQRRPRGGQPPVRRRPRRLRDGRGGGDADPGGVRARQGARRHRLRPRCSATACRRTATTSPCPVPAVPGRRRRCSGRWTTPAWPPATSITSTPTAPRPSPTTSPRRWRSRPCSGMPPGRCRSRPPSR